MINNHKMAGNPLRVGRQEMQDLILQKEMHPLLSCECPAGYKNDVVRGIAVWRFIPVLADRLLDEKTFFVPS